MARVEIQLLLSEAAGQLGIGLRIGEVEPRLQFGMKLVAEVGKKPLVVLRTVLPVSVGRKMRQAHIVVERPHDRSTRQQRPVGIVAAILETGIEQRSIIPRVGDEIHRAAERGRAIFQSIRSAKNLDRLRGQRLDHLEIETSVRKVDRNAVLQELEPAPMKGALDARTTDGNAGLLRAESRLHENARRIIQGVLHRGGAAVFVILRIDDLARTGDFRDLLAKGADRGIGQRLGFGADHGFRENRGRGRLWGWCGRGLGDRLGKRPGRSAEERS